MNKAFAEKAFRLAAGQVAVRGEWAIVVAGFARRAGVEASRAIGTFDDDADNSAGEDGDLSVGIDFATPLVLEYMVNGTGADEVTAGDIGEACYWLPDQSVTPRSADDLGADYAFAGIAWELDAVRGVGVEVADAMAVVTASATLLRDVRHELFFSPEPAGEALGTISESEAGPVAASAQPGHPRTLRVAFAAGWSGGDVVITSTGPPGEAVVETFVANPGNTVAGTAIHANLTSWTNTVPAGAADLATIEVGDTFGVGGEATKALTALTKLTVDGTHEAFASTSLALRSWKPTSAPNGERNYEVWYTQNASYAGSLS